MSHHFFAIPALYPAAAQDEFNAFCIAHRVLQVDRQFVAAGVDSHWALCAVVAEGAGPLPPVLKRGSARPTTGSGGDAAADRKLDYKQLLSDADFTVFAALRAVRKQLAEQEGVPLYVLFTNEQLATIARQRCTSLAVLAAIDGVGDARPQRYGAAILQSLAEAASTAASQATPP